MSDAPSFTCSALAHDHAVQQIGSAQAARTWLLIEYPKPYGAQAVEDFWATEMVGHEHHALSAHPNTRVQLIKRRDRFNPTAIRAYVAIADDRAPRLYRFEFATYPDLLALDLAALERGEAEAHRSDEALFIICTNGKRDACCAKHGLALNLALAQRPDVWETSHIGGHRFAPTLVALPHGLYYGQLAPIEASAFMQQAANGQMSLAYLRGRSSYPREAQVCEYYLRQQTGNLSATAYQLIDYRAADETGRFSARFRSPNGQSIEVRVAQTQSDWETYFSCDAPAPKRDWVYRLLGLETGA